MTARAERNQEVQGLMSEQEQERPTIRLVYLGPLAGSPGKYVWRSEQGERCVYGAKMRSRVPGGIYTVETADGTTSRVFPGTLTYAGEYSEDAAAVQLEAQRAELETAAKRLEANASRTGKIDETLDELLAIAAGLKTYDQRHALAAYVTNKILRAR